MTIYRGRGEGVISPRGETLLRGKVYSREGERRVAKGATNSAPTKGTISTFDSGERSGGSL